MEIILLFIFLIIFLGIITGVMYLLKDAPSKKKTNITKKRNFLIPDSIFGIGIYVLLILLCIFFLGDYGYERGPRFFGDPG